MGKVWVIHNHYKNGKVEIDPLEKFSEGVEVFYDTRPFFYSIPDISNRAIQHYFEKNWRVYNTCKKPPQTNQIPLNLLNQTMKVNQSRS